jgi:methyl-accepting chemotaxis protein
MNVLATERLINRTRYLFTAFFLLTGFTSYRGGSDSRVYLAIFACSGVFLLLAAVNEVALTRRQVFTVLVYLSTTVELGLFFFIRYAFSFEPSTGYTMTMKEPATFTVYFLFGILNGLRFNRRLNLYYGLGGIAVHLVLVALALTVGGMHFSSDPSQAFALGTLRIASEGAKVLFMLLFTGFLTIMAGYTRASLTAMERARGEATANAEALQKLLTTARASADDLLKGSRELVGAVGEISGTLARNNELLAEIASLSTSVSDSIGGVNGKSHDQFEAARRNSGRIDELMTMLSGLRQASGDQGSNARDALRRAEQTNAHFSTTLAAISEMRARSEKIDEISRTIKDIADQTNLLSLNASIEAARAGENGRGFAVVAGEINKLAGRSAESSAQIEQIIRETVKSIADVSGTVETMAESLGGIGSFVRQNSTFMEELSRTTEREQEEGEQLRKETLAVHALAKEIQQLATKQEELNRSIGEWTGNMTGTSREIARTLDGLSELSGRLETRSRLMTDAMAVDASGPPKLDAS